MKNEEILIKCGINNWEKNIESLMKSLSGNSSIRGEVFARSYFYVGEGVNFSFLYIL